MGGREEPRQLTGSDRECPKNRLFSDKPDNSCGLRILQPGDENSELQKVGTGRAHVPCKVLAVTGLVAAALFPAPLLTGLRGGMPRRFDALRRRPTDTDVSSRELSSVLPP